MPSNCVARNPLVAGRAEEGSMPGAILADFQMAPAESGLLRPRSRSKHTVVRTGTADAARFSGWALAFALLALLPPATARPEPAATVAFPPAEFDFGFTFLPWTEGEANGQRGWFAGKDGLPGVHRVDQGGGAYRGPAIYAGASVFLTQGVLGAKLDSARIMLINGGLEIKLGLVPSDNANYGTRGALVWFMEAGQQPFDVRADTRFGFRADPVFAINHLGGWRFAWMVVDREGAFFVSSETFEHTPKSSAQTSDAIGSVRWARADFSSPDLFQDRLDFNGPQPVLAGLRGAGVYGQFEMPDIDVARFADPLVWVSLRRFAAGDSSAVAALFAADAEPPAQVASAKPIAPVPSAPRPSAAPAERSAPPSAVAPPTPQVKAGDAFVDETARPGSSGGLGPLLGGIILAVGLGVLGLAIWGATHIKFGGPEGGSSGGPG